jgi:hypothetical protein
MADRWYYAKEGQRLGPITFEQLKELANSGAIQPATLAWCEGMPEWTAAGKLKDLTFPVAPPASSPSAHDEYGVEAKPPELPPSRPAVTPEEARPAARSVPRPIGLAGFDYSALAKPMHAAQIACWGVCAIVMVFGLLIFLLVLPFATAQAAAAIFATIFISIYGLCRAVEKLARLVSNPPDNDD